MDRPRTSLLRGTALLTGTGLFGQGVGFLYRIALARTIGAEQMGLYQLLLPVLSVLLSLTAVGLTAAVSNLSAQLTAEGRGADVGGLVRLCLRRFGRNLLPVALVVLLGSDALSVHVLHDARTRLGLVLLLPCTLLTGLENLQKHSFYGTGRVGPPAAVEVGEQLVRAGAVLGLLHLFPVRTAEETVGLIVLGMTLCELWSAGMLTLLTRCRDRGRRSVPIPPGLGGRVSAISRPVGLTALLGNLLGGATSVLIPGELVRGGLPVSEAMAAFGVLSGMTLPLLFLPTAFIGAMGLVLVPRLARYRTLGRLDLIRTCIHKAMLATSVLVLPALTLLVILGPTAGKVFFQEGRAGDHLLPLSLGVLFTCYQSVLAGVLNGLGQQRAAARNALVSGAAELLLTPLFMSRPGWGLGGYVLAFDLSAALGAILNWRRAAGCTRMRPRPFQWWTAPVLASLLMGLTVRLLFHVLWDGGLPFFWNAGACLVFGGVLCAVTLSLLGVDVPGLFHLRRSH